jgi:CheY-like chemotaxis protein
MLGRNSRILVADDSSVSRNVTHQALFNLGYKLVDHVPDGLSALRLIEQKNYSLVVSEWTSDRVKGGDILQQIRTHAQWRCLPFLMVIPQWQRKFIEIVREDGATLYLTRPFTPHVLHERMVQVDRDAGRLRLALAHPPGGHVEKRPDNESSYLWRLLRPDAFAVEAPIASKA